VLAERRVEPCDAQSLAVAWQRKLGEIALAVLQALYPDALPPQQRSTENAA
jgi:hypothetical protein